MAAGSQRPPRIVRPPPGSTLHGVCVTAAPSWKTGDHTVCRRPPSNTRNARNDQFPLHDCCASPIEPVAAGSLSEVLKVMLLQIAFNQRRNLRVDVFCSNSAAEVKLPAWEVSPEVPQTVRVLRNGVAVPVLARQGAVHPHSELIGGDVEAALAASWRPLKTAD